MDDNEKINKLQGMLMEAYVDYVQRRKRPVSQNEFARKGLGVSPVSYSQWITGTRMPDYQNVIILSRTLGVEIFDIMGFPRVPNYADSKIQFIAERWTLLDQETQEEIFSHVKETINSRSGGGQT